MRKLLVGLLGAGALAMGSAANATMVVSAGDQVSAVTGGTGDGFHYDFSYTSSCSSPALTPPACGETPSAFEATVTFINDVTGDYSFGVQQTALLIAGTSDIDAATDVDFTDAFVTLLSGGSESLVAQLVPLTSGDVFEFWGVSGVNLAATAPGDAYVIHILGNRGASSSFDGSIHFGPNNTVPEPGTWAMMLLGFGAVGWQLRRRRRPVLLQAA